MMILMMIDVSTAETVSGRVVFLGPCRAVALTCSICRAGLTYRLWFSHFTPKTRDYPYRQLFAFAVQVPHLSVSVPHLSETGKPGYMTHMICRL